ncbi:MAG: DUF1365 domain-containing protein [Henriciella sp.]
MTASPAIRLHQGHTLHRRYQPFVSQFRYKLFMLELDIDRLGEADKALSWFSVDGANLFSFRRHHHGDETGAELRPWAEKQFAKAGIDASQLQIRLISFPQHLFYKFAPISLWLALDREEQPVGIIYEVRNTFGEKHNYVAALEGAWSRHSADKVFHVSPFFDVSGTYEFSLQYGAEGVRLGVTSRSKNGPTHLATLITKTSTASDLKLLRATIARPLSTLGVTLGIHWEALKLWIKGARYRSRPVKQSPDTTVAASDEDTKYERVA